MAAAPKAARFMHDLPAKRGLEVTDDVMDGPQSIVFQQAENRMHLAKGLLVWLLGGTIMRADGRVGPTIFARSSCVGIHLGRAGQRADIRPAARPSCARPASTKAFLPGRPKRKIRPAG